MDWFSRQLLHWFDDHGRKDLPWQHDINPYRVWVSEIMLQQTQVASVIGYYQRFMTSFPTIVDLANASMDDVLHHWSGLGYYARGRNLHKTANIVTAEHNGEFPVGVDALVELPGIGPSTAGAIAAIAQQQHATILDGNVKRVLARYHTVAGHYSTSVTNKRLWFHANAHTPVQRTADYTQAIMDLGATVCVRSKPKCLEQPSACPLSARCAALATDTIGQYPEKKAAKVKPVRAARMWVLHNGKGLCLLEQRPPTGIWGGLWTPPERELEATLDSLLAEVGITSKRVSTVVDAETFRHTFSHYHLDISPSFVELSITPNQLEDGERTLWYDTQTQQPAVGLAKPAATLLQQVSEKLDGNATT